MYVDACRLQLIKDRLDAEKKAAEEAELAECTFKPKIGRPPVVAPAPVPTASDGTCGRCAVKHATADVSARLAALL